MRSSKKFLDHILTDLCRACFVYSKKGKGGGYALARLAHDIMAGDLIRVLDALWRRSLAPRFVRFVPATTARISKPARFAPMEARNAIAGVFDNRNLAEFRTLTNPAKPRGQLRTGRKGVWTLPPTFRLGMRTELTSAALMMATNGSNREPASSVTRIAAANTRPRPIESSSPG